MKHYLFLISFFFAFSSFGQKIHVSTDKESASIADPIQLTIQITHAVNTDDIEWPELNIDSTIGGNFEIWEVGPIKSHSQLVRGNDLHFETVDLSIITLKSGYVPFERITAKVNGDEIESNALLLAIDTIKVDTTLAFNDIKPLLTDELTSWESFTIWMQKNWWWVTSAIVLTCILIILWKRKGKRKSLTPLQLHELYLNKLQKHVELKLYEGGNFKDHYQGLTDLIQDYLLDRFGLETKGQTSEELTKTIKSLALGSSLETSLNDIVTKADFVKFAKSKPTLIQIENHHTDVISLFESTKEYLKNS